jgi:hypothetical protein
MPEFRKVAVFLGIFWMFSIVPVMQARGVPLPVKTSPELVLLHQTHGYHCGRRHSSSRGWHRHREACRDRHRHSSGWGWCWNDAYGNQLCFGDIRRRDPGECRKNPYALGCRTERWDNR